MLARGGLRSTRFLERLQSLRRFASEKKTSSVALGEDGKHEIWRDGIYDHDNEPQVNLGPYPMMYIP